MTALVRIFVVGILASIAALATYALASSNSGMQGVGEAAMPVSGWVISNFNYQLSDDPTLVKSVTFDLNAPADDVKAKLDSTSTDFTSCTNTGGYHWECYFPGGVQVSNMDEIRVVAVDH